MLYTLLYSNNIGKILCSNTVDSFLNNNNRIIIEFGYEVNVRCILDEMEKVGARRNQNKYFVTELTELKFTIVKEM